MPDQSRLLLQEEKKQHLCWEAVLMRNEELHPAGLVRATDTENERLPYQVSIKVNHAY